MCERTHLMALLAMIILSGTVTGQDNYNTTLVGHWAGDSCYAVDVSGNIAYFGDGLYLEIIDISDPANLVELGRIGTPSSARGIAVSGSYVYVANGVDGLRIIDVSIPSSPQEVSFLDVAIMVTDVAVSGNYAYVTDAAGLTVTGGLHIIDVSTPSSPQEVGLFVMGVDDALAVAVSDSYAYVTGEYNGLQIIDVSTPSSPQGVDSFDDTYSCAYGVAVSGSYAYVAYGDSHGLRIFDVSIPSSPQEVVFFDTDSYSNGVAVSGSYAYVANDDDGLRIIDVSTPSSPQEVGFFGMGGTARVVAISGSCAYVADWDDGLYIIQNNLIVGTDENPSLPDSFVLQQNYPNPFNPLTTISYDLPEESAVNLTVFDIRGQEITTLLDNVKPPGNYEVQWSGNDQQGNQVSTGVYFCRFEVGSYSQTIKMVYLR
mgnify:CR=1 FL=1